MGEERRITDLTAISAFRANDYIAVDNASEAQTKKLPASAITGAISAAQTDATRALNIARSTSSFPTGDAYSSSSAYKVGDMVIYNNTLYRCKTACSPASWSVNASNFEATSLASALTDVNNDLMTLNEIGNSSTLVDGNITATKTITLTNDVLSNYRFVYLTLYQPPYNTSEVIIPMGIFKASTSEIHQVYAYNGTYEMYVSIKYGGDDNKIVISRVSVPTGIRGKIQLVK